MTISTFFVLLMQVLDQSVLAADLEQTYAKRLLLAKNSTQIHRLEADYEAFSVAQESCRQELRKRLAPVSCYESLGFQVEWGMVPKERLARVRHELDLRCERAGRALRIPKNRKFADLTKQCRASLAQAKQVEDYRAQRAWD
jgi:hypothetical protein